MISNFCYLISRILITLPLHCFYIALALLSALPLHYLSILFSFLYYKCSIALALPQHCPNIARLINLLAVVAAFFGVISAVGQGMFTYVIFPRNTNFTSNLQVQLNLFSVQRAILPPLCRFLARESPEASLIFDAMGFHIPSISVHYCVN